MVVQVYVRLTERLGIRDHMMVLTVMLTKICTNLKAFGCAEDVIQESLTLFSVSPLAQTVLCMAVLCVTFLRPACDINICLLTIHKSGFNAGYRTGFNTVFPCASTRVSRLAPLPRMQPKLAGANCTVLGVAGLIHGLEVRCVCVCVCVCVCASVRVAGRVIAKRNDV